MWLNWRSLPICFIFEPFDAGFCPGLSDYVEFINFQESERWAKYYITTKSFETGQ